MKQLLNNRSAFTLIEIIIAMTIFGIIMVSVLSIFLFSSQMSTRVEMNRLMQENIKNVTEDISENLRLSSLADVIADGSNASCAVTAFTGTGTKLCLKSWVEYTIGYFDESLNKWTKQNNISECRDITKSNCHIIKADGSSITDDYYPLSNSFTHFENMSFEITNQEIPKVSIHMTVRPSAKKWLAVEIVENGITHIQTTLSERLITTN